MLRLLAIAIPAVLLLGAPASAPAKGIVSATVCGADGCRAIPNADLGLLEGGAPADPPVRPEPFVRVSIRVGVPDHVEPLHLLFLPRSELVLADDGTTWMVPMARSELQAIARRVARYPARELQASVARAGTPTSRSGGSLPPEVFSAQPADADGGFDLWWLGLPGTAILLAIGAQLRRRRDPPGAAAGAASG